jgi:nitrite reductase (NO-forming)
VQPAACDDATVTGARPRATTSLFQTGARAWATASLLSFALPPSARLGLWLPVHLMLAGAVATAISGAMQNFALALTAGPAPSDLAVRARFALLSGGVVAIGFGMPLGWPWLVALGGASFSVSMGLLGWVVWRASARSLQRRHRAPLAAYFLAVAAVLIGATLGAVLGAGVAPSAWAAIRRAHMLLNVLGFGSLTVAGTLLTFLPTLLRVRIPPWRGWLTVGALAVGAGLLALGELTGVRTIAAAGGVTEVVGAGSLVSFVVVVFRRPRRFAVPVAAVHAAFGMLWFVGGVLAVARTTIEGAGRFDAMRRGFLVAFVAGWLVQVLLGAWGYLLPMATPGHPDDRRRQLVVAESGGLLLVMAYNAGAALLLASGLWWPAAASAGWVLLWLSTALLVARSWAFVPLARGPLGRSRRGQRVWGA